MHAKTDSDVASFDPSSPSSPKRTVYYVHSPSRDSHDGDKSSTMQPSPMDSPSHQSYVHHSRASSSSRISGGYNSSLGKKGNRKGNDKGWPHSKVIEEEDGDFYHESNGISRRFQIFIAIVGFVLVFAVFCFIIWAASLHYKPQLSVKSLTVHNFYFGEGSDITGVPTKMLTVNCSMRMTVHNPASFFGIYVSSKSVNLMYSEVTVATGELKKYHQQRKSRRTVSVNIQGSKVPLYGAGASFASLVDNGNVSTTLVFEVKSRGNVVGKLVRTKHTQHVSCSVAIDPNNNKSIKLKENECKYI
ncbi:unnamed protein product [Lathyrus oleraceus]|uniref:Late embryogenesis abundant protein LEA-2 subgroup domain-containing protein n=1 Tax=Pisum sativum TaxID=3888 RepID=A0A9D4YLP1_PEA|nr:NDR1/HIN1-like protein 12 [Pisum sativum]KAI5441932.1 hypothetical protein KIW84_011117 [Pisum sativum]